MSSRIITGAFAVILLFTLVRFLNLDRDLTSFVCLAKERTIPELFDRPFNFQKSSYDGFYFYTYSHDPLAIPEYYGEINGKETYHIEGIIQSANYPFRKKRIGYSALSYLLSGFGYPPLIPATLVVINILCFVLLIQSVRLIISFQGGVVRWSYFAMFFVGSYISLARDLSDLMAISLATFTVYLLQKRQLLIGALLGTLAIFTKENVIFMVYLPVCILFLQDFQERKINWKGLVAWVLPITLYLLWNYHLWTESLTVSGYRSPEANFTYPFIGILEGLQTELIPAGLSGLLTLSIYSLAVESLISLWHRKEAIWSNMTGMIWPGIFIVYFVISVCFSYKIYEDFWSLGRNLMPLQIAAFLTLMITKGKVSRFNVVLTAVAFVVIAGLMMVRV